MKSAFAAPRLLQTPSRSRQILKTNLTPQLSHRRPPFQNHSPHLKQAALVMILTRVTRMTKWPFQDLKSKKLN
jgi:hypothetical protein